VKADSRPQSQNVRYVPKADIRAGHHVLFHYGDRAGSKNARARHLGDDEPVAF